MYDLRISMDNQTSDALLEYAALHNMDVSTALADLILCRLEWAEVIPRRTRFIECVEHIRVRPLPEWIRRGVTFPREYKKGCLYGKRK